MKNKNGIAAILAITVLLGFLGVIASLIFREIPAANKDFFNTALIALVGLVGTAFGFYLGSSYGSFVKSNPPTASAGKDPLAIPTPIGESEGKKSEAGFALIPLLQIIAVVTVFFTFFMFAGGCASLGVKNETPESLAAKGLLTARQGIIAAAQTADTLCTQGIMKRDACDQARKIYADAQPAYTAASDAFMVYLAAKDTGSRQRYEELQPKLTALFTDIDALVKRYGSPQGGVQ